MTLSNSALIDANSLLVTRVKVCRALGVSRTKLRRLVRANVLHPVYLTTNPNASPRRKGNQYFRTRDILALIEPPAPLPPPNRETFLTIVRDDDDTLPPAERL